MVDLMELKNFKGEQFHIRKNIFACVFSVHNLIGLLGSHRLSCNLTPPVSRVLIGQLIFYSMTSPTCCNSPRKCTPVKCKAGEKAGFPIVT